MIDIIVNPDEEFLEDDEMELRRYGLLGHPAHEDLLEKNEEEIDYDRYR